MRNLKQRLCNSGYPSQIDQPLALEVPGTHQHMYHQLEPVQSDITSVSPFDHVNSKYHVIYRTLQISDSYIMTHFSVLYIQFDNKKSSHRTSKNKYNSWLLLGVTALVTQNLRNYELTLMLHS